MATAAAAARRGAAAAAASRQRTTTAAAWCWGLSARGRWARPARPQARGARAGPPSFPGFPHVGRGGRRNLEEDRGLSASATFFASASKRRIRRLPPPASPPVDRRSGCERARDSVWFRDRKEEEQKEKKKRKIRLWRASNGGGRAMKRSGRRHALLLRLRPTHLSSWNCAHRSGALTRQAHSHSDRATND